MVRQDEENSDSRFVLVILYPAAQEAEVLNMLSRVMRSILRKAGSAFSIITRGSRNPVRRAATSWLIAGLAGIVGFGSLAMGGDSITPNTAVISACMQRSPGATNQGWRQS